MLTGQISGIAAAKHDLQLLAMPANKTQRILGKTGRELQKMTRQNIRQQRDIYGKPLAKRTKRAKAKKQRLKLVRKMGKQLRQKTSPKHVTLGFKGIAGNIAAKHHHGDRKVWTKSAFKRAMKHREKGQAYYDDPATKEQAGALVKQLGFKVRNDNGQLRRVSQKWVRDNLTIGVAGSIIKDIRERRGLDKRSGQSWVVNTPSRKFFATTDAKAHALAHELFTDALTSN